MRDDEDVGAEEGTATRKEMICWALFDWGSSAYPAAIHTFLFAAYFTRRVAEDPATGTTQWGITLGLAGLVVGLGGPVLGAMVDQLGRRKPWLGGATAVFVAASALLWFVEPSPSSLGLALGLLALGTIGQEAANIVYNAMLPVLAPADRLGRWSGWGCCFGYVGGLGCLLLALVALIWPGGEWLGLDSGAAEHVRAAFVLVGAWIAVFSIPLFVVTPDVPSTGKRLGRAARDALGQIGRSVREVRKYSTLLRFIVARWIYTDGLASLFVMGGLYAVGVFGLTETQMLLFGIALNVAAGVGAVGFAGLDDRIGGKWTILIGLCGLIGFGTMMLLVESTALFWACGIALGVFVGPVQASSRSFFARLAPGPLRNQMFGLYSLSGKATAFQGPLWVGAITAWTGSQRLGMSAVIILLAIGAALMLLVPSEDRQAGEARASARRCEGGQGP